MKDIKLNFNLVDLDGNEIKDSKLSKILAGLLMSQKSGDAVKFFDWAVTLHKSDAIQVDASDLTLIKGLVKDNSEYLTIISKAQLLKYFDTI